MRGIGMINETCQSLKWYAVWFKLSTCIFQGFLDISNALECHLKAHTVRTSHTSVCGGIDASLFVSCGQFRYFWCEQWRKHCARVWPQLQYIHIRICTFHYVIMAFVCYNWSSEPFHGEGAGVRLGHLHLQETRFVRTCKSLCPKMMSTGQRGLKVNQECTHACQG